MWQLCWSRLLWPSHVILMDHQGSNEYSEPVVEAWASFWLSTGDDLVACWTQTVTPKLFPPKCWFWYLSLQIRWDWVWISYISQSLFVLQITTNFILYQCHIPNRKTQTWNLSNFYVCIDEWVPYNRVNFNYKIQSAFISAPNPKKSYLSTFCVQHV